MVLLFERDAAENLRLKAKARARGVTVATIPTSKNPVVTVASRVFSGNLNASDLRYMAMAIMQMSDDLHELRERVRQLEAEKTKAPTM